MKLEAILAEATSLARSGKGSVAVLDTRPGRGVSHSPVSSHWASTAKGLLPTRRVPGIAASSASPETWFSSSSGVMTSINASSPGRFSGAVITWLSVTPYLRQCGPPAFSATLPPIVHTVWLDGSGA